MSDSWTVFRPGDTLIIRSGDRLVAVTTPDITGVFRAIDESDMIVRFHVSIVTGVDTEEKD